MDHYSSLLIGRRIFLKGSWLPNPVQGSVQNRIVPINSRQISHRIFEQNDYWFIIAFILKKKKKIRQHRLIRPGWSWHTVWSDLLWIFSNLSITFFCGWFEPILSLLPTPTVGQLQVLPLERFEKIYGFYVRIQRYLPAFFQIAELLDQTFQLRF